MTAIAVTSHDFLTQRDDVLRSLRHGSQPQGEHDGSRGRTDRPSSRYVNVCARSWQPSYRFFLLLRPVSQQGAWLTSESNPARISSSCPRATQRRHPRPYAPHHRHDTISRPRPYRCSCQPAHTVSSESHCTLRQQNATSPPGAHQYSVKRLRAPSACKAVSTSPAVSSGAGKDLFCSQKRADCRWAFVPGPRIASQTHSKAASLPQPAMPQHNDFELQHWLRSIGPRPHPFLVSLQVWPYS